MGKNFRGFLSGIILMGFVMISSGCVTLLVGAAAGAGGVVWAKGALQQTVQKPVYKVHTATLKALKKLDMPVLSEKKDAVVSKVESEFSDGKSAWVTIKHISNDSSEISIRVGILGDEIRSRQLLTAISRAL